MTIRRQSIHKLAVTATCSGVLALAVGCGNSSKPATPTPGGSSSAPATSAASTTASATPDPTADADAQALGVYKNMVTALTAAMTTNNVGDLAKYASGGAYQTFVQAVTGDVNTNIIYTGAPQTSPKVSATGLSASPKFVTITDCFGGPGFVPTFAADDQAGHKKGQSAVGKGQSTAPHPLTVQVVNRTGTWLVEEYTLNPAAAC